MDIGDAKISQVLEVVSKHIAEHEDFTDVPIYWDEAELDPNSIAFPCIQLQPLEWEKGRGCDFEREFQVRIITSTESKREALLQLYDFEEKLREIIDEVSLDSEAWFFELRLIGGTSVAMLRYVTQDRDSYKSAKTNYGSIIAIRYNLRY